MEESLSSTKNILNLNDDCLEEVFRHLDDEMDLCAVADVCVRFRAAARAIFESKYKNYHFFHCAKDSAANKLLVTSRMLRNFGANVKTISLRGECADKFKSNYQNKILELLRAYCGGSLVELNLRHFKITDEISLVMWPVLSSLQKLSLIQCEFSELFLKMLPACAPELRNLDLLSNRVIEKRKAIQLDGLQQSYDKLANICFMGINDVKNIDIEELVKRNPQLKQIHIMHCRNLDDNIFQSIATHVPHIETLRINNLPQTNDNNAKYLGQLSSLNSLEMSAFSVSFIITGLREINAARIPLEHLSLSCFNLCGENGQFVDVVSQLKHLTTLKLISMTGSNWIDIQDICKRLNELSELYLVNPVQLSAVDLLETVRNAEKLKMLYIGKWQLNEEEKICFDVEMYLEMVEVVSQRREKVHLLISTNSFGRFRNTALIPKKLIRKYKNILSLQIN